MTMGERIKQLRSANGFTQEMLAEKMNVSVRQLQNGKRQTKIIRIEKSEFTELQRKDTYYGRKINSICYLGNNRRIIYCNGHL